VSAEHPALSVVVPARNEASRLDATFSALEPLTSRTGGTELVFVLDASSEDNTLDVGERIARSNDAVRLNIVHSKGKGNAVAVGVLEARGDVVLIADADLSVDPSQFESLVAPAVQGALAIASRSAPGSRRIGEPASRYLLGRLFNAAVRSLLLPGIRDSQCGFKAFPRAPLTPVFGELQAQGWCFDVELIARARRAAIPVVEVPVQWRFGHGSKLRPGSDAPSIARELLDLRRRYGRVP
jgi:glycosyltransferase involved in cell wall biosynthesis